MADKPDNKSPQSSHSRSASITTSSSGGNSQVQAPHPQHQQGYQGKPYKKPQNVNHGVSDPSIPVVQPNASGSPASGTVNPRQSYSGQGNKYYNKRNYNNQKGNNHNKQYPNAYAFSPNMYSGNYFYPYTYPQGMMPNVNGMPAYPPQSPQPIPQFSGSPSVSKVKITDKDGKQVDLEEKKSSSSTPKAVPAQVATPASPVAEPPSRIPATASLAPAAPAAASAPSALSSSSPSATSSPAPSAAGKSSAADEFRRKIFERAQKAKQKKAEEEKAKAASVASPPLVEEPKAELKSDIQSHEPAVGTDAHHESSKLPEPTQNTDTAIPTPSAEEKEHTEIAPSTIAAKPSIEKKPVDSSLTNEELDVEEAATPTFVEKETEANVSEDVEVEPQYALKKENVEDATTNPDEQEQVQEQQEQEQDQKQEQEQEQDQESEQDVDDEDEDDLEEDAVFDLSSYFDRLSTASKIEDPFSFSYPYPLTGVDGRWKSGSKKYRYDPQFLLQFRDFVQYPIDDAWKNKLEGLGIVPNKRSFSGPQRMNSNKFNNQGGRFNGSIPGRLGQFDGRQNSRNGSKRRGGSSAGGARDKSSRNKNQSKRGKETNREEEAPKIPTEEVKPLVPSANRWVPRSRMKKEEIKYAPDGSVILDRDEVERKTNSALNKLTLEMFEPISKELLDIVKQSVWEEDAQTIKQVISLTFAKACDEPYWSSVYAQFCAKMTREVPEEIKDVNTILKTGEPATGGALARRILLATCQVEYEKGWTDKLPTKEDGSPLEPEMMSDEYYAMAAAKRRGLGLLKFIGNLYILNMLNDSVILHCLRDQSKNVTDPSEDSLENLAQLIKTVGPRFESTDRNRAALGVVYDNIQEILDNCKLSSRIRFILIDLQDLRKNNWKSIKQDAGPKTIKEIHNEAELKKIEESRAQAERRRQNKGSYNSSNYGGGDSRSYSARGSSSWGNKKDSRAPTKDSRGFTSVSRTQSNRPALETSASSTNMASRESSKRTDSMASNIFAALGGDNDEEGTEAHGN